MLREVGVHDLGRFAGEDDIASHEHVAEARQLQGSCDVLLHDEEAVTSSAVCWPRCASAVGFGVADISRERNGLMRHPPIRSRAQRGGPATFQRRRASNV